MKNLFLLISILCSTYSFCLLPSNLKAYYTFNGSLNDSMGLSTPAINNGATACADRMNINNKAYEFDGTGNNIDLGPDLNFSTSTIAFWFKPYNVNPTEQLMLSNAATLTQINTTQIEIRILSNSKIHVFIGSAANPPASFRVFTSNTSINISKWNHVSVQIINNCTQIKIYINGILDLDQSITGLTYSKCTNNMRLGTRFFPTNEGPYYGKIDEVMIFNKALSDLEAKSIYSLTNGIEHQSSIENISIYPNPSNGEITIELPTIDEIFTVSVLNSEGKLIKEFVTDRNSSDLKLKLDIGIYLLNIRSETKNISKKVIFI